MNDVLGRELKVGDEVAFTVGSYLKTGKIVEIKDRKKYGRAYPTARINLTVPEMSGGYSIYRRDEQGGYAMDANGGHIIDHIGGKPKLTRDVYEKDRIVVLRAIAG